jgi:hypothetical protein
MKYDIFPDLTDSGFERQLIARDKRGPRIKPQDVQRLVVSEHFFTAMHGAIGRDVSENVGACLPTNPVLGLITFCVLVLKNDYPVTGVAVCESFQNFDPEIGRRIARQDAASKIWPLLGYEFKHRMAAPTC